VLTLTDPASNPQSYIIRVTDNSTVVEAEAGKTYIYNFADGSVLPQTSYSALRYSTFITDDGILTMNSNTGTESLKFGFHDNSHGGVFFPGNSFDFIVAGNATVTFTTCQYGGATDAYFRFTDSEGVPLDSIDATNIGAGAAGTSSFSYTGAKGVITATLLSPAHSASEIYIHGVAIENAAIIEESNGKTDVWDFGAAVLDTSKYNNMLSVDTINSWYAGSITVGSTGNVLPSFSAGVLSWVGGGNDRLRSTNTNLTRYDDNLGGVASYTGRVYVNSGANPSRYMSLTLSEDDEVTIVAKTDAGGNLNFEYVADPEAQTDEVSVPSDLIELTFVAKEAGTYHIFDDLGKPSYFRIYRKDATYVTLTGSVDLSQAAGIPGDYAIRFTNKAGKTWTSTMGSGTYSAKLPAGYTYYLSLGNANGYIINNGTSVVVTDTTTSYDISIEKVELYTVNGNITGLGTEIHNLNLVFGADTAQHKVYLPEPVIDVDAGTYTVKLEPGCQYTISALGVNDFYIPDSTLTIGSADATFNIVFAEKPLYPVTINATGLTTEQLNKLSLTFTNLYEGGYAYSFSSVSGIELRDGTYAVSYDSLDTYPVEMGLASNLKVNGAAATKTLAFNPVTDWPFDDKEIPNGISAYKGLLFTGNVSNEIAKGHLSAGPGATIKIPVSPGDKLRVTYYYSADFSIDGGDAYTTASNSTSTFEYADYTYSGTGAGYVTITVGSGASKTYFTNISIGSIINYEPIIYVGADKTYKTINAALDAIGKMDRNSDKRVTVMIDPGNYEEMLVVSVPNITFKNASSKPDIKLSNHGVDISGNAVRITSYFGHGYNYYSMGNDQKWNADVLRVNKENGYLSYENAGSGTTNGSYWNTTVLINANGFVAEDIIFENSFNQYISKKESEDIVVMWESGSKGERPTDYGNTAVQDKGFVERAAAIAIVGADKVILNRCRVIGRQDSFYGSGGSRVVIYKGSMMGSTDYMFGAMTAVFYKSDLAMNTSEDKNDVSYLTAAQQGSGRGYLMYECTVTSAAPGTETASAHRSKPGYFGRPWQATTSEVVFYNTTVETTNFPGSEGESLIRPLGWDNSLGGESALMYEYGTIEESGEDNIPYRADWATVLDKPTLTDGTEITTFNFTKGADNWDPIPALIAGDTINEDTTSAVCAPVAGLSACAYGYGGRIYVAGVESNIQVTIYSINGTLVKSFITGSDTSFDFKQGLWIINLVATEGQKVVKVVTY
jgi:pectin methylesterase-like acyl-CoA thioesterase